MDSSKRKSVFLGIWIFRFASADFPPAGGLGRNAEPSERRSPAALLVQSRTQQKSFLFLLPARRSLGAGGEEKIGRAQNQKCEENFFAGWRALASGGGAERQFRSKKVRAFSNKGHKLSEARFVSLLYQVRTYLGLTQSVSFP